MKKKRIVHGDSRPENLMYDERGNLCLGDFGLAEMQEKPLMSLISARSYRPPEVFFGIPHDSNADVWSTGCWLYELGSKRILFSSPPDGDLLTASLNQMDEIVRIQGRLPPSSWIKGNSTLKSRFEKILAVNTKTTSGGASPSAALKPWSMTRYLRQHMRRQFDAKHKDEIRQLAGLFRKMLSYNSASRISSEEALLDPVFEKYLFAEIEVGHDWKPVGKQVLRLFMENATEPLLTLSLVNGEWSHRVLTREKNNRYRVCISTETGLALIDRMMEIPRMSRLVFRGCKVALAPILFHSISTSHVATDGKKA